MRTEALESSPSAEGLCLGCRYNPDLLLARQCVPGDVCVRAHSGRQIDRFMRCHPGEAHHYLHDLFWERRAIAARYSPIELIGELVHDPDEVVRRVEHGRLRNKKKKKLMHDPDRDVRLAVASRIGVDHLSDLIADDDYLVRATVARRLPHGKLTRLAHDPDREVRKVVAQRLPPFALHLLAQDPEPEVRARIAERALPDLADQLILDPEWWVRLVALNNASPDKLAALLQDPEAEIRECARKRLESLSEAPNAVHPPCPQPSPEAPNTSPHSTLLQVPKETP